jgi:hypothetical protein
MMSHQYLEQFERVRRWHMRLQPIAEGIVEVESLDQYRDDMFAFFMNCYHLKDWIKNDPSAPHLNKLVEAYITASTALSLCADLCNGIKHLVLDSSRSGSNPQISPKDYHRIDLGAPAAKSGATILVITDTGNYDAFDLAGSCIDEWQLFLMKNDISYLRS